MNQRVAAFAAAAAALLLAAGALTPSWLTRRDRVTTVRASLRTVEICAGPAACERAAFAALPGGGRAAFARLGSFTFYLGLAAAAALLATALLTGSRRSWPIEPSTAGIVLSFAALVSGLVFLVLRPARLAELGLDPGYSAMLFVGGAVVGLVSSIHAGRTPASW